MEENNKHKDIDALLKRIFTENPKVNYFPLQELFDQRLAYLEITKHQASKILDADQKTIDSILVGDAKKVDFVTILKLSNFLEIPYEELMNKYFKLVADTHNDSVLLAKKRSFIVNNFDLPSLKKLGFIESINDFEHIEERINAFFGYDNLFEHSKYKITAAFSSGKRVTNKANLMFWYAVAGQSLDRTPNPNEYDREGLIEFFPQIRWHSMNLENGLQLVAQALYKFGVTLIVVPKFNTDLHIKGATLSYRDKPCIVLTKYTKYYATIWFTLIHEIFHVLYDWDEIRDEKYHITGETNSVEINESEADSFARQYLFSDEKMKTVTPHINEPKFVKHFAEKNHVHPSIIYTFYSFDNNDYKRFHKQITPDFDRALEVFGFDDFNNLKEFKPIKDISSKRNLQLQY